MIENSIKLLMIFSLTAVLFTGSALAQDTDDRAKLLAEAQEPFLKGEYENAIKIFDEILEIYPTDSKIFELKGIALSNLRLESTLAMQPQQNVSLRDPSHFNKLSMLEFYKALEINPNSVLALNGMGLGFGNFGEYSEAEQYFKKALEIDPDNEVTQNYLYSLEKLKEKYSLDIFENPTKKPDFLQNIEERTIPYWVKNNAGWWAEDKISDDDFVTGIEYLIKEKIISISSQNNKENSSDVIPSWIKNNAGWWSAGKISDENFLSGIKYLIVIGIINIDTQENSETIKKELKRTAWNFEQYLEKIKRDIENENRYIEYPNPSDSIIIKYWKEPHKWNLETSKSLDSFEPTTVYLTDDDVYIIEYKIFVNDQPPNLPLDHVGTLQNSFKFWEEEDRVSINNKKAIVKFELTNLKADASAWVTWVVRDLGEDVLGHATIGRGVVEVALGDYGCDGSFQLFTVDTVETIMTHELGHSLGMYFPLNPEDPWHSENPDHIMYPTLEEVNYSFCLLN